METLFLGCFLFGALFTVASVLLGAAGSTLNGGHAAHAGHLGHGGHGHADLHHGGHGGDGDGWLHGLPLLNLSSLLAFVTWFGAAGFVAAGLADWPAVAAVGAGMATGLVGAVLIAAFLRKVMAGEREMDPREYRLEGTIARVTVSIPAGGTGEVLFSKAGTRRSEAARSLGGAPIPRDTEVVVVEYTRGVAAVQPWDEFISRGTPEPLEQGTPPAGGA